MATARLISKTRAYSSASSSSVHGCLGTSIPESSWGYPLRNSLVPQHSLPQETPVPEITTAPTTPAPSSTREGVLSKCGAKAQGSLVLRLHILHEIL